MLDEGGWLGPGIQPVPCFVNLSTQLAPLSFLSQSCHFGPSPCESEGGMKFWPLGCTLSKQSSLAGTERTNGCVQGHTVCQSQDPCLLVFSLLASSSSFFKGGHFEMTIYVPRILAVGPS